MAETHHHDSNRTLVECITIAFIKLAAKLHGVHLKLMLILRQLLMTLLSQWVLKEVKVRNRAMQKGASTILHKRGSCFES